jgi:hypothetical protein
VNKKRTPARTVCEFLFNAALVASALIFAFIVLVREEQYAFSRPENPAQAIEQAAYQSAIDVTGKTAVIPPSN